MDVFFALPLKVTSQRDKYNGTLRGHDSTKPFGRYLQKELSHETQMEEMDVVSQFTVYRDLADSGEINNHGEGPFLGRPPSLLLAGC